MRIGVALLLAAIRFTNAFAQDGDAAALSLADQASPSEQPAHSWHAMVEAASTRSTQRRGDPLLYGGRLSLDLRLDEPLAPGIRVRLSDRLDLSGQEGESSGTNVNTLKEAYVSWQPRPDRLLDFGRINARTGVATGYNPTDYLRTDAARSIVSIDPGSLRENRLGSVMMRGQALWAGGSLTALFTPRLADAPSSGTFSPDWGATNHTNRWLITLSEQLTRDFSPQLVVFGAAGHSPQVGLNLTHLLNSATVGYLEWSGGRSDLLASPISGAPEQRAFRSRFAAGLTYTAPIRLSLTLEFEQNDAAADRARWDSLRNGPVQEFAQYLSLAADQQDLATRRALFTYVRWEDALTHHLDLAAFSRRALEDHSQLSWMEARYHWQQSDAAVQWQTSRGGARTVFGASSQSRLWQVLFTHYFP